MAGPFAALVLLQLLLLAKSVGEHDIDEAITCADEQGGACFFSGVSAAFQDIARGEEGLRLLQVKAHIELGAGAPSKGPQGSEHALTEAEWNATQLALAQLQDVAGAHSLLPTDIAPMLELLRGLHNSSKQEIAAISAREAKSKKFFAEKEDEHEAKLAEIEAHAGRVSEGFHANQTRDEERMWGYWQRVREREHHQFLTFLKIKHGIMQKVKDMIDVYEKIVSGSADDAEIQKAIERVSGGSLASLLELSSAPTFLQEALDKVSPSRPAAADHVAATSPYAPTGAEWAAARSALVLLQNGSDDEQDEQPLGRRPLGPLPTEMGPMLELLKDMYNSSKKQIVDMSAREQQSKEYFATKEGEHKARLQEIEAKRREGRLSEEFYANETREAERMWEYWQTVRDHEHHQFLSFLKIKHATMKKVKDMIDVYEEVLAGNATSAKVVGDVARAVGAPLPTALLQRAATTRFCQEALEELRAARQTVPQ